MTRRRRLIGFDREVQLAWLDAVAAQVASGMSTEEVRRWLDDYLSDKLGGEGRSGHRGKTVTVLTRIWSNVPSDCRGIRDDALLLLGSVGPDERLAVHWAMATAVYPFFGEVTVHVGRLLSLQGDVVRAAVIKRLVESWGDRPAVHRACRAVWSSLVSWGAMAPMDRRGHYHPLIKKQTIGATTVRLLAEATVQSLEQHAVGLRELRSWPGFFAFEVDGLRQVLAKSQRLTVDVEGSDLEMVRIRD